MDDSLHFRQDGYLSEENFLKNSSFSQLFKLRASWGLTGNAEIGESSFLAIYIMYEIILIYQVYSPNQLR